jgi:hypothetical protein
MQLCCYSRLKAPEVLLLRSVTKCHSRWFCASWAMSPKCYICKNLTWTKVWILVCCNLQKGWGFCQKKSTFLPHQQALTEFRFTDQMWKYGKCFQCSIKYEIIQEVEIEFMNHPNLVPPASHLPQDKEKIQKLSSDQSCSAY